MSLKKTLLVGIVALVAALGAMQYYLDRGKETTAKDNFNVGYLPVTCHLTCPVTHFINEQMTGDGLLQPQRFSAFPELTEAFLSDNLQATFILAPLAMRLRDQGRPVKIVYLGHRDGTTMMVRSPRLLPSAMYATTRCSPSVIFAPANGGSSWRNRCH